MLLISQFVTNQICSHVTDLLSFVSLAFLCNPADFLPDYLFHLQCYGGTIFIKKILTFASGIHIIINGKFVKQIFGIIGNGTSSWMVMNNTNL